MENNKLLRVTQMNAVYFDKEIFNVFKQQLSGFFKYLPPEFVAKCNPEINILLRLAILRYSLMRHNSTFGQKLLSIKYVNLTYNKKIWYLLANCFDYLKERLELSQPSSIINKYFHNFHLFLQAIRLLNISLFLQYGSKPLLIDRCLGLEQVFSRSNAARHYEDKYMTRELIWNGLIEVLVYLLPLVNYHKLSRVLRNINLLHKKPEIDLTNVKHIITKDTLCSYCGETPIVPCHMGCLHVFCYSCLKGNQTADLNYECPECEFSSKQPLCERVYG